MYWPITAAKQLSVPPPLDGKPVQKLRANRKGNFLATLSEDGLGVWDIRPTVLQAAVVRSPASLERWGHNADIFWAHDGRGIIVLTSTSHLLFYQLQPSARPAYDSPSTSAFPAGGGPGEGDTLMGWSLVYLGVAFVMGTCTTLLAQSHSLMICLRNPPSILTVPYPLPPALLTRPASHFPPPPLDGEGEEQVDVEVWDMTKGKDWMVQNEKGPPSPVGLTVSRVPGLQANWTMRTEDGRVYIMRKPPQAPIQKGSDSAITIQSDNALAGPSNPRSPKFTGHMIYPVPSKRATQNLSNGVEALGLVDEPESSTSQGLPDADRAAEVTINPRFGLIAIGTAGGTIHVVSISTNSLFPRAYLLLDLKHSANLRVSPGRINSLAWTSDGYCLAAGHAEGWAVWSVGGRLGGWGVRSEQGHEQIGDAFNSGVQELAWVPGNLELLVLSTGPDQSRFASIPFVKSATTTQHSPDNTRYAFLQMDDRVLVYRGADQPDMSVINPESDVWQHIKIPNAYISTNWPIRYAAISSDGKLVAVAGRHGLTHYSAASGRWKLFEDVRQERDFVVRGGLLWFHHVLVAAVEVDKICQIRLYSRDTDLNDVHILHSVSLRSPVQVMSLLDNSLLVYTSDNTLYHFLIIPTKDSIRLHLCGSINFLGIVHVPSRVRAMSWLVPQAQKNLGDPADDLIVATIIFLVDGKLVLLRPRRAGNDEVRYDMQVLADKIESYWTHLHGLGTLENSLWGFDGTGMRVWLDALTIEATKVDQARDAYESVKESVYLDLDFYPLSILMDKGIIIGVEHETSMRSLPFSLFKLNTGTHLFLPPFLRHHLSSSASSLGNALLFAANYHQLVYFAHSLEILLHSVLEDDNSKESDLLETAVEFLDYFPESLDVVVSCARKTELERWGMLFDAVGKPRDLFEKCLEKGALKTAASYLLVLHNLEQLDDAKDTVRLLRLAMAAKEYRLCKELLRFLRSIDESGSALRTAIEEIDLLPAERQDAPLDVQPAPVLVAPIPALPITNSLLTPTPPHSVSPTGKGPRPPLLRQASSRSDALSSDSGRVSSPFDLSSPRVYTSPPSPLTIDPAMQGQILDPLPVPKPAAPESVTE